MLDSRKRVNLTAAFLRRRDVSTAVAERIQIDLDIFVAQDYPQVVAAVGLITGNRQDAADAVQDAIVGFLAKPPSHPVTNLAAWFTVVASNRVRDGYRSQGARDRALAKLGPPKDEANDAIELLDVDVMNALKQLPLQQRQVCALHYLMDQSVETIAEGLAVSPGTVKTQLHRARKTLAARLRKEDHHD
ncbi:MAG: sigma-70 family RNA polymerase sigma factor [Salinibacterium sp.]|nr:MAG: sigma-70 family RNA polymerase sigma factor [Salinibacterium sp.]